MSRYRWLVALCCAVVVSAMASVAVGEESPQEVEEVEVAEEEMDGGFRHKSSLQIRVMPIGLSLFSDTAYRQPFSLLDSDSPLFDGTYVDGGVSTSLSPSFLWAGPYVELLPIAILRLRAAVQFMSYFGSFGYLHAAEDGQSWDDETLDRSWDEDLGQSATGWMVTAQATPQILIGRVVATAETTFHRIQMDMEDPYYEPYFDLLFEPTDSLWITSPTLGYLFGSDPAVSHLVLGLRWERAMVSKTELVRDTVGVVWNWKVPPTLLEWGSPAFSGFAGAFIEHPTRGRISPYVGMQIVTEF